MKALIELYLTEQGIKEEPYKVQFLRFTTQLDDDYNLTFPKWRFNCPRPEFTPQEVKDACKCDLVESMTNGINNKLTGDEATNKIDELNSLTDLKDIKNFVY